MQGEHIHTYMTAIGMVSICSDGHSVTAVYLPCENLPAMEDREDDITSQASEEIDEYLSGRRKKFDVPVYQDGTEFQRDVWDAVCAIPYGKTATYGEIAETIGRPGASRAVGTACGLNRIPLIIPCHRVVPKDGTGNYAGGRALKIRLLTIEKEYR